jgi:hypothetical protein
MQVPTMYVRLLQGYDTMDAKLQKISSNAARQLRLMVHLFNLLKVNLFATHTSTYLATEFL